MLQINTTKLENVIVVCDWDSNTITFSDRLGNQSQALCVTHENMIAMFEFINRLSTIYGIKQKGNDK